MSNRNLSLLGFAAVAVVALAVIVSGIADKPYARKIRIAYLIQGLDPDQIAKITVGRPGYEITFLRRGDNFFIANLDNYPALTSEINKLITNCLDIQTSELCTDNPQNHKDLGVTEDSATILVKFYKADSLLLTGIIVGRQKGQGQGIGYVRRVGDNNVYISESQIPGIKQQVYAYISPELTNVKREDINSVTVSCPNETYVLRPGSDDRTVIFENMAEGKKLNNDVADKVLTALADLSFEDVNAESSRKDLQFDTRYLCRLKDSTVYTIWLAKDGDKWFVKCDADFADKAPITKTQGEIESDEQLKIKEAKLLARDAAEEFSEKHKGWVYRIPSYLAENMAKSSDELFAPAKPAGHETTDKEPIDITPLKQSQ